MKRLTSYFLSSIYTLTLLYIVFFAERRTRITTRMVNIHPFKEIYLSIFSHNSQTREEIFNHLVNLLGNIAIFIPLPLLLYKISTTKNTIAIFTGSLLISFIIEFIQYSLKLGVADIDDILLNSLGIISGISLRLLFIKHLNKKISI